MQLFKGLSAKTTDQELITQYKRTADLDYVAELYKRYLHLIFAVTLKYLKVKEDAEDLSIKVFEVLKDKLPEQEIENVGGWIHTVTKNECLMHLRSVSRNQKKEDEYASFMEIDTNEHQNYEIDVENDLNKLEKCIDGLVKEQKQCITLFYKQEKCYREVANLTGHQLKKVKSYLQNGKRNLAICMGSNNG